MGTLFDNTNIIRLALYDHLQFLDISPHLFHLVLVEFGSRLDVLYMGGQPGLLACKEELRI